MLNTILNKNNFLLKLAVSIIVIKGFEFLFLKKNEILWVPPGGRVQKSESLQEAAIRELKEETGLVTNNLLPVDTWRGKDENEEELISVTFMTSTEEHLISLSTEHSEYKWCSNLEEFEKKTSYNLKNWKKYAKLYKYFTNL